jgi:hypothetical protein
MTTNVLGDFAKCSVISKIIPEHAMYLFAHTATEIWSLFVNQPQTARCLTLLHLLGMICEVISVNYEVIVDVMEENFGLSKELLDDDFRWTQEREAIDRLEQYLWELKALQLFHQTVSESIDEINDAESRLLAQIDQGPGRRHEMLEQMAQGHIEVFRRRFGRLRTISNKLQQKIDHLARFRDGISSISSLQDSRTSIRQDSHLEILTWITIGYLPLTFVVALFAVPGSQNIVADALGLRTFLPVILLFFLSTVLVANFLGRLISLYKSFLSRLGNLMGKADQPKGSEKLEGSVNESSVSLG